MGQSAHTCPNYNYSCEYKQGGLCACTPDERMLVEAACRPLKELMEKEKKDSINPSHYKSHASGIECIQITEHMSFTLGNAIKYIWRADLKHDDGGVEDLKKALWYLNRELDKRQSQSEKQESSA